MCCFCAWNWQIYKVQHSSKQVFMTKDTVWPRGVLEENGSIHTHHNSEQTFNVRRFHRTILNHFKEVFISDFISFLCLDKIHNLIRWMRRYNLVHDEPETRVLEGYDQLCRWVFNEFLNQFIMGFRPDVTLFVEIGYGCSGLDHVSLKQKKTLPYLKNALDVNVIRGSKNNQKKLLISSQKELFDQAED